MKAMFKGWLTLVSVFGLLVVVMDPARAEVSTDLADVISALPPGFAAWLGLLRACCMCWHSCGRCYRPALLTESRRF